MKKINTILFYKISVLIAIFLLTTSVNAQKGPAIQQGSLRAPEAIKIDGFSNEWGSAFKAYNPTNHVFYTVANDDKNFYLIARMDGDGQTISKALLGGISLRIQPLKGTQGEKKLKSITFPARENRNEIISDFGFDAEKFKKTSSKANAKALDSLSKLANKKILTTYKEIEVTGMDEEGMDRISLYNTEGIKVSAKFNSQMEYTIEISIPLQFLNLNSNAKEKFKYSIALIGTAENKGMNFKNLSWIPEKSRFAMFTTDLWGDYTLTK